jgi:hypothetical protein
MLQFHSGGSTVSGPLLSGQQVPGAAIAPQPDSRVAALMVPDVSGGSRSTLTAREVLAAAAESEEATETRTVEEATTVKVAVDKAVAMKASSDKVAMAKVAANKAVATRAVEEAMAKVVADAAAMKTIQ